jgi:O-antigen ligase
MSGLFLIKDSLTNKISYYHLVLLMASLPFDMFYSHLILISYAIHTLIHLNKNTIKPVFNLRTLALQSVFYVTILSTIYTINRSEAFNEWEKQLTIFLFPLVFCLNPLDVKKYAPQLLLSFALVCTATIIYFYTDALVTIKYYKLPFSVLFSNHFTNHNFSEPIFIHATFFSMQVALSLVYLVYATIREKSFYRQLFYGICGLILTAGIIQLSSKAVFISLILTINIILPYFLLEGTKRFRFIIASVAFTLLAFIIIYNSGTLKQRFVTELKQDLSKSAQSASLESRLERWKVAAALTRKSPLIGYGAGSEIGLLQKSFFDKKLYNAYLNRLNAHNEYLSLLIKSGIIGLLIYAATLVFGFNIAFRQKDIVFFAFMSLIALVSMSENILDVDKGVFFYAFFFSFFTFSDEVRTVTDESLKLNKNFAARATKCIAVPS